jgi:hypothetical protein
MVPVRGYDTYGPLLRAQTEPIRSDPNSPVGETEYDATEMLRIGYYLELRWNVAARTRRGARTRRRGNQVRD